MILPPVLGLPTAGRQLVRHYSSPPLLGRIWTNRIPQQRCSTAAGTQVGG